MSIGDTTAFPYVSGYGMPSRGMTYRQWLIGKALSGVMSQDPSTPAENIVDAIFEIVDRVIARQDKEQENELQPPAPGQ